MNPLLAALLAKKPDGSPRFERADLLAFLPILLGAVDEGRPLPAALGPLLDEVCTMMGLKKDAPPAELQRGLQRYYERNPQALHAFKAVLQALGKEGVDVKSALSKVDGMLQRAGAK